MQKLSMEQLNRPDVESFKTQNKTPIVIVLDNVRSMHNVGSAFRTADGFAIEKILLCGITGTPPHREIEKTALGATQSVVWEHVDSTQNAVQSLKDAGYKILAIEQAAGSINLHEVAVESSAKYAFVFGNEVHGVSEEVMQQIDACIEIPQFGTKHSLNVSVTVGIVVWHFLQKLKFF
ncbi:RNA methyltransferase [Sphingobacterium oryzagri]|uniref:RNA methyltransferase n=1 Tax=Sphingobacterium oryzagri TaxID=3025669 RepID=A0ABY7WML6_9SPHI|nr:RNA methyltransferase [Sphingobacterium sp. KACC 22765]WDF69789.1 RNA methyltransferase [Sphingobacterium sp. KACC 22765]